MLNIMKEIHNNVEPTFGRTWTERVYVWKRKIPNGIDSKKTIYSMIRNKEPKTDKCLEAKISLWDMLRKNQSLLEITNLSEENQVNSSNLPYALQVLKLHITFLQGGPD